LQLVNDKFEVAIVEIAFYCFSFLTLFEIKIMMKSF